MPNEKNGRILEVRSASGQLLFSLRLVEMEESEPKSESQEQPQAKQPKEEKTERREEKKSPYSGTNNPMMSDAQKRYLFRILAEQGLEGDAAYEHLKKALGVESLKEVSKQEASREIERRLEELREGGAHG